MTTAHSNDNTADSGDALMTSAEVAATFRVDQATVRNWAHDGRVPSFTTPGGQLRFRRADITPRLSTTDAEQ